MRILAMLIVGLVFIPSATAGELKTFKDWVVGCDNLRTCTALGLPSSDDIPIAYVKIVRGGEATSEPSVELVSFASVDTPPADAKLAFAFDDPTLSGLSSGPLPYALRAASFALPLREQRSAISSALSKKQTN